MRFKNGWVYSYLGVTLIVCCVLGLYIFSQYTVLRAPVKEIQITFNSNVTPKGLPTVYLSGKTEEKLNFQKAYKFEKVKDSTYSIKLDDTLLLRRFRCYFEYPGEKLTIYNINLVGQDGKHSLKLNKFKEFEHIKKAKAKDKLVLDIQALNGYFTNPKRFLYASDFVDIYQLLIPLCLIIALLGFLVFYLKKVDIKALSLSGISLAILILSIFMPAPIYNVALILAAVVNIRKISFKAIYANKINLLFIAFFLLHLFSNVFISEESYTEMSTIDRFLPFLILSLIIPSIATKKLLGLFPLSAIAIGFGLLMTSIFDVYVHQNLAFVSFNGFTKYLHPVYYSYLLFFSIMYIHHEYHGNLKHLIQLILFGFLVFSGSKLVLLFTIVALVLTMRKNKKAIIGIGILGLIILLFSPLNNRFKTIFQTKDLSILEEKHIDNDNDPRINGLTLRLILWRETLSTMEGMDYIIGDGVSKSTNKKLFDRMTHLGLLHHQDYKSHNQYVDTFWRTGIIGLVLLLMIPIFSLIWAIRSKEVVLAQFCALMLVVMLTENIFGRVNGIYFFTLVILLITNSRPIDEHSDYRN
ncbi:MAG: O-antigen ligase family protein [Gelidibacter sp.]